MLWNIKKIEKNKSELSITVYPYILSKLPKLLAYIPHQLIVKPKMTTYLNAVLGGIEYFIENRENVPRNHFGTHKFSSYFLPNTPTETRTQIYCLGGGYSILLNYGSNKEKKLSDSVTRF